jgi:hypothetical protein
MIECRAFDDSDFEYWMEHLDRMIAKMKRCLDDLTR